MKTSKRLLLGTAVLAVLGSVPVLGMAAPAVADAAAPPGPIKETAYVVWVTGKGDYTRTYSDGSTAAITKADVEAQIDRALRRWEVATDDRIVFTRKPTIDFAPQTSCASFGDMRAEALKNVSELSGVDTKATGTSGNHLIVITPPGCGENGIGDMGTNGLASGGGVSLSLTTDNLFQNLVHELGHNFGLGHANAVRCPVAGGDCAWTEYKDHYSPMGSSFLPVEREEVPPEPAFNSYERTRLGVVADGEIANAALPAATRTHTFTFDLRPRSSSAGLRGVTAVDPTTGSRYYFDFRNGSGVDSGTPYQKNYSAASDNWYNDGITVTKSEPDAKGYPTTTLQTFPQLDGTGYRYAKTADPADVPFEVGGLKMRVLALQDTHSVDDVARIAVTVTDPSVPLSVQDSGAVAITAAGNEGDTLTATTSGWAADATVDPVQWLDGGTVVGTGPTYTVPAGTHGHRITATVTGHRESYVDRTATSNVVVVGQGYPGTLVVGATYELRTAATGKLASSDGVSTAINNVQMVLTDAASGGSTPAQRWTVLAASDGTYRFKNVASGKCLDDERARTTEGNPIIQWGCGTGVNQFWSVVGSGNGWALVNQTSKLALTPDGNGRLTQAGGGYAWTFTRVG